MRVTLVWNGIIYSIYKKEPISLSDIERYILPQNVLQFKVFWVHLLYFLSDLATLSQCHTMGKGLMVFDFKIEY